MENLFELVIWLVIMVFFWLIPTLTKKNKQQPTQPERQPYPKQPYPEQSFPKERTELEEKILETLGFPAPKPIPRPPIVKEKPKIAPVILEKKPVREIKAPPAPAPVKAKEEALLAPLVFTPEKLQEGIILSTVLGPPKSTELRFKN